LTSELSLICNDRHSEKVNLRIFSGNDETLLKTKSLEALHQKGTGILIVKQRLTMSRERKNHIRYAA